MDMGIDRKSRHPKAVTSQRWRSCGQRRERTPTLKIGWNNAIVFFYQNFGQAKYSFGLLGDKPTGLIISRISSTVSLTISQGLSALANRWGVVSWLSHLYSGQITVPQWARCMDLCDRVEWEFLGTIPLRYWLQKQLFGFGHISYFYKTNLKLLLWFKWVQKLQIFQFKTMMGIRFPFRFCWEKSGCFLLSKSQYAWLYVGGLWFAGSLFRIDRCWIFHSWG